MVPQGKAGLDPIKAVVPSTAVPLGTLVLKNVCALV